MNAPVVTEQDKTIIKALCVTLRSINTERLEQVLEVSRNPERPQYWRLCRAARLVLRERA